MSSSEHSFARGLMIAAKVVKYLGRWSESRLARNRKHVFAGNVMCTILAIAFPQRFCVQTFSPHKHTMPDCPITPSKFYEDASPGADMPHGPRGSRILLLGDLTANIYA